MIIENNMTTDNIMLQGQTVEYVDFSAANDNI